MITDRDLWIFVLATLLTGALVTLYVLPAYFADRRRWNEPVEPIEDDGGLTAAAVGRFIEREGSR